MAGKSTDLYDGPKSELKWPVYFWASQSVHNTAPQKLNVPSPIPPHAAVTMTMESLTANAGYSARDKVWGFRERISGANDYIHPMWDDRLKSMALISGNATNAYYLPNKATGANTGLTSANWNQRIYGYWTDRANSNGSPIAPRVKRDALNSPAVRILHRKWIGPWEPLSALPQIRSYELKNFGHSEEPAVVELWLRCISSDGTFQTDDEICPYPDDIGTGTAGIPVWHKDSVVGFTLPSGTLGIVGLDNAIFDLNPSKWHVQLRVAFAAQPEDMLDGKQGGRGIVAMHYTRWKKLAQGQTYKTMLPQNFNPISVFSSVRCAVGSSSTGNAYNQNDQYYSRSAGYAGYALFPTIIMRGRQLLVPLASSNVQFMDKAGVGGGAILNNDFDCQFRLIG